MLDLTISAALGWLAGALVNYLGDVLPIRRKLSRPFCTRCLAAMKPLHYWVWPRRCAACGIRRSWRTWIVEGVLSGATAWLYHAPPDRLNFWVGLVLLVFFAVVIVIDVEHRLILHPVSLVGAVLGLVIGIGLHGWTATLLGGLAGFTGMLGLYLLGVALMRLIHRWQGQENSEEALGFGDVTLSGVLGLLLGWPGIVGGLIVAILLGGVGSCFYLVYMFISRRYRPNLAIPYGPFLVVSAILLLFFNNIFR